MRWGWEVGCGAVGWVRWSGLSEGGWGREREQGIRDEICGNMHDVGGAGPGNTGLGGVVQR